jgi:tetratricopeptide (TPR) repeat protein
MSKDAAKQKEAAAKAHHKDGRYEEAADAYVESGYEYLGAYGLAPFKVSPARGLTQLAIAAACLRHIERMDDCRNLCWQGVYVSEAIGKKALDQPRASYDYDQSKRGVWFGYAGDFKLLGDLPGKEEAYEKAKEVYIDAGDPQRGAEQLHMAVIVLTKYLLHGTGMETDELRSLGRPPEEPLSEWIEFKRRRIPEALERLDTCEEWTYVF